MSNKISVTIIIILFSICYLLLAMCRFGPDELLGSCGMVIINSSKWGGISRCPGLVNRYMNVDGADVESNKLNDKKIYVSFNPNSQQSGNLSLISSFLYDDMSPVVSDSTQEFYMWLSSNSSAGPILIDHSKSQMFFVDQNRFQYFIAKAPIYDLTNETQHSTMWIWLHLAHSVSGFAMDATISQRKIYWSYTGTVLVTDGGIWYANMDDDTPSAVSLVSAIGQSHLIDPMGLTIDYRNHRLVWVDRQVQSNSYKSQICLKACNLDGSNVKLLIVYDNVTDHNTTGLIDLVIDIFHNNTAYFVNSDVSL